MNHAHEPICDQTPVQILCGYIFRTQNYYGWTTLHYFLIKASINEQHNSIAHFCIFFSLALNIHEETRVPWSWFNRSSLAWLVVTFTPQLRYLYKVTHHFSVSPNNCSCCGMNSSETKLITLSCFFVVKLQYKYKYYNSSGIFFFLEYKYYLTFKTHF